MSSSAHNSGDRHSTVVLKKEEQVSGNAGAVKNVQKIYQMRERLNLRESRFKRRRLMTNGLELTACCRQHLSYCFVSNRMNKGNPPSRNGLELRSLSRTENSQSRSPTQSRKITDSATWTYFKISLLLNYFKIILFFCYCLHEKTFCFCFCFCFKTVSNKRRELLLNELMELKTFIRCWMDKKQTVRSREELSRFMK